MSKPFIIFLVLIAALAVLGAAVSFDIFLKPPAAPIPKHKLTIGETDIFVDVARTAAERTLGLSGMEAMPHNEGLLFIFEKNDTHAIWMKDMRFPIDIIWIDESFMITEIVENALPSSFPEIFEPKNPARYVLETNAGWAQKNDVRIGAKINGLPKI